VRLNGSLPERGGAVTADAHDPYRASWEWQQIKAYLCLCGRSEKQEDAKVVSHLALPIQVTATFTVAGSPRFQPSDAYILQVQLPVDKPVNVIS
jgi:hypothetical protein